MKPKLLLWSASVIFAFILHPSPLNGQGSLTPPGAPAETMKTLNQIEARTPVDAVNTPGTLDEQFAITQPGSYYLTGNITGAGGVPIGIVIETNDVTLDLNGFALTGLGAGYDGIVVAHNTGAQNVVIRNGTVRNWQDGVDALNGYCELDHVRAYGCESDGFELGDGCTVRNCTAAGNGGAGMLLGNGCAATDCLVSSNGSFGMEFGNGCVVSGCVVCSNANTGISGGRDCVMSGCLARVNFEDGIDLLDNFNISRCTSNSNYINGFHLGNNGQIRDCVANTNGFDGIDVLVGGIVSQCTVISSGYQGVSYQSNSVVMDNYVAGAGSYGIAGYGTGSRVEGNQVRNSSYGIYSGGGPNGDVIVRNTSSGNSTSNYFPTNGTTFGPLQTPAAATSPTANF